MSQETKDQWHNEFQNKSSALSSQLINVEKKGRKKFSLDDLIQSFLELFPDRTYLFAAMIRDLRQSMSDRSMIRAMKSLIELSRSHYQRFTQIPSSAQKATTFHTAVDQNLQQVDLSASQCREGCASCCHWRVEISHEEAELLADEILSRKDLNIDLDRLSLQAREDFASSFWKKPLSQHTRCVFLSDDLTCQVYDKRPMACRKCLVASPPKHCEVPHEDRIDPIVVPEAELLTSLSWSLSLTQPDLMARKLKPALEKRGVEF